MRDFNSLERGWEAAQWRRYEADCAAAEREPTILQQRQALMARYCTLMGWSRDIAASKAIWLKSGATFAAALGGTVDALPPATHGYTITPAGRGVWHLTHRKKRGESKCT